MKEVRRIHAFGPQPGEYICASETAAHPERLRERFARLMSPIVVQEITPREYWNLTRIGVANDQPAR